jgi:hypothetical protein
MAISDYFELTETEAPTHRWVLRQRSHDQASVSALADELADAIVRHRTPRCPDHYQAWRTRFDGGAEPPAGVGRALLAFLSPAFGLPGGDVPPDDHLEGFVAEHLWYFLAKEATDKESTVRIEPPSFRVTDQGGDGLIIHRSDGGVLMFRLWEIKKATGERSVSATVGRAYRQLDANAISYLARYASTQEQLGDPDLDDLYGQMLDLWVEASPMAAAGIAVNTSVDKVPRRCFTTFGDKFPRFTDPVRLWGMVTAVSDFGGFAKLVQRAVWRGL